MDMEVSIHDTHSISFLPKFTIPFVEDISQSTKFVRLFAVLLHFYPFSH